MIKRGLLKSFDAATWTASVQVLGSQAVLAENVPVSPTLPDDWLLEDTELVLLAAPDSSDLFVADVLHYPGLPSPWIDARMIHDLPAHDILTNHTIPAGVGGVVGVVSDHTLGLILTTDAGDASKLVMTDGYGGILVSPWSILYASGERLGASSFRIGGNFTDRVAIGTKLKLTDTTTKYFVVTSVSYSAPYTTIGVDGGGTYALVGNPVFSIFFSNLQTVGGFPIAWVLGHHATHESGGVDAIKLDDLTAPDDNTDLNVSTAKHGLAPKAPNDVAKFLRGDGTWAAPSAGASGPSCSSTTSTAQFTTQGTLAVLTVTRTTLGGDVLLSFNAPECGSSGSPWQPTQVGYRVDGGTSVWTWYDQFSGNTTRSASGTFRITGLSAASHTFDLMLKSVSGSGFNASINQNNKGMLVSLVVEG